MKIHYLYKITNQINYKVYVGQTVSPTIRWRDHLKASDNPKVPLQFAIKKYGSENFEFEVIASCKDQDAANYLETELVEQYNSFVSNGKGYNATRGGMNAPKTEEWKRKVSKSLMGHPVSEFTLHKLREARLGQPAWNKGKLWKYSSKWPIHWNNGRFISKETRLKMSQTTLGRHYSPETEIKKGEHLSPDTEIKEDQHLSIDTEFKKGVRTSPKTEFKKGFIPWNKGIPRTEEYLFKVRKFSPEQELIIANDPRSSRVLAKEFNCNKTTILDIRKRNKKDLK